VALNHEGIMTYLTIDEEFQSMIPPLAPEELELLEASLLREGCRDPLVAWFETFETGWCKECEAVDKNQLFAGKEVEVFYEDGR
jgi:hypothetical protein